MSSKPVKAYNGVALEGWIAKWYAGNTRRDMPEFQALAKKIAAGLPAGSAVLEVAPGPGFLAIELAKTGGLRISGLDISESFVRMARASAASAGVEIDFRHGNAACMPFDSAVFDRVVCRAAFKKFAEPVQALLEMHRVLRPGGNAVIIDLCRDAPRALIDSYVDRLQLGAVSSLVTRWTFRELVRRAYTQEELHGLISKAGFRKCDLAAEGIGFEVWLEK